MAGVAGYANVQRRVSERDLVRVEPGFGDHWRAAKNNPYLSLAPGPVAGWLTGWLLISAWGTYTYAGTAVQYAIILAVVIAFVVRGARLFERRGPKKVRPTIGREKQLLVALREAGRPTCRR
ncbi:MAG: hypothetical protein ACR2JR_01635 [Rubrobacteraceae bacterium]